MSKGVAIHWYRKGLRIHDNPALLAAISACHENNLELCPLFILDSWIIKKLRVGPNRWRFLQQSLCDLDTNLRNIGSRLYVLRGTPENIFPEKFQEWNVKILTFEVDIEPYARERDERVLKLAKDAGVKVIQKVSHTLYDPGRIIQTNMGKTPLTYQKLLSLVDIIGPPQRPVDKPSKLSDNTKLNSINISDGDYSVPSLAELGVDDKMLKPTIFPGGETAALQRLSDKMENKEWVRKFEKPNTSPNSLEPSTTVLSPYLKFGCLSARTFYYKLKEVIGSSPHSKPPVSLFGQLIWREFYYVVGAVTPNFDKMEGNPICCQVPWSKNEHHLAAWAEGKTGYPFIDAIMIQLRTEGWIHHLARHAVACFLTRGDLWISWEEGQKVFEELLLDADWALNAGNWMWLSASAFFHQFFRVYSPVVFGKKTDKFGEYIKKYIPALRKFPPDYIYEPWKAPLSVQKQAGCIVGKDYPTRIVIHEDVYKINIKKMSDAYKKWKGEKITEESETSSGVKKKKLKTSN